MTENQSDPSSTVSVPHLAGKQANPKNFRTITLFHSPDEYTARTNAILALEIPVLFRDGVRDEYISFLNAHRDVIPYFPAIIFENDFSSAIDFLSELIYRVVICENAGLLSATSNAGFSVVPGFHLNITNSYSIAGYYKRFKCPAFIPSPETTAEQLANMTLPDNTELWLLPSAKNFLMQSRQCLVGRASGCKKAATDRECLKNCERSVSLVGRQGESIIAEKRPGFYSCLRLDKSSIQQSESKGRK